MAFKDLFIVKEATGSRYQSAGELLDADANITAADLAQTDLDFAELNTTQGVVSAGAVYGAAGLEPAFNRDIRNIEGFIASLPDTMETDAKKASLAGILAAAQFHTDELLDDYDRRVRTMESFLRDDAAKSGDRVRSYEQDIVKMLSLVEDLRIKITAETARGEEQRAVVEQELSRLAALRQYL